MIPLLVLTVESCVVSPVAALAAEVVRRPEYKGVDKRDILCSKAIDLLFPYLSLVAFPSVGLGWWLKR